MPLVTEVASDVTQALTAVEYETALAELQERLERSQQELLEVAAENVLLQQQVCVGVSGFLCWLNPFFPGLPSLSTTNAGHGDNRADASVVNVD
jgi:hypothetical protein